MMTKPKDKVRELLRDNGLCKFCIDSSSIREYPYFCFHDCMKREGKWTRVWDDVNEPCTKEDWETCPLNK